MMDYLKELNEVQREAVTCSDGPSLVIAGAGSGKTRVLTYRIAYLLDKGIKAEKILALTFTNKAAREMKERIIEMVGYQVARNLWMGTFHSIFSRILRANAEKLGYTSNFTIYDSADSKNLVKKILKDLNLSDQTYKPNEIFGRISSAKNNLITPQAYRNNAQIQQLDIKNNREQAGEIYQIYVNRCRKADAMDFDDLLLMTNILFRDMPEVLAHYQDRFSHILVDEYQDTNYAQYLIVKKLADKHKNVCVVGDDAQSIYSFRGALIENILNFRNDYKGYRLFKLEQNYRSTQTIVKAANSIISKNKDQIKKNVFSNQEVGERVQVIKALTDNEEGFKVANDILDTRNNYQVPFRDFAILYRTNAQSRIFEESLRKKNIPYKVFGSLSFYQRKEIKDVLAYLRFIVNPRDDEALKRIINFPARGIGNTTLDKIEKFAISSEKNLWEVIDQVDNFKLDINKGITTKLKNFAAMIRDFRESATDLNAFSVSEKVVNTVGILKEYNLNGPPENISKYENIQELLNSIREFTENAPDETSKSLTQYLENVALLSDQDKENNEDTDRVTVMTIHSSKGLEFGYVYIAGVEEELFPNKMTTASEKDLQEERRLFYVALTRAKKRATISFATQRYKWGNLTFTNPSRFIKDIDAEFIDFPAEAISEEEETLLVPQKTNHFGSRQVQPVSHNKQKLIRMSESINKKPQYNSEFDPPGKIQSGMQVLHARFGKGKVINLEGVMPDTKATVYFPGEGQKQLLLKFARLKIIQ